jgi:Flp pilus assembly protein TadB
MSVNVELLFSIIFGIGALIFCISFLDLEFDPNVTEVDEFGNIKKESVFSTNMLQLFLISLSKMISPNEEELEDRLRRAGYPFKSVAEFHSTRMLNAVLSLSLIIVLGLFLGLPFVFVAGFGAAFTVFGFLQNDRRVNNALIRRKKMLKNDLAFGVSTLRLFLTAGQPLTTALYNTRDHGLFGGVCELLARNMSTNAEFENIKQRIMRELPETRELEEFFTLIEKNMQQGTNFKDILAERAESLQEELSENIVVTGKQASINIGLMASSMAMIANLMSLLGPVLLALRDSGF